MKSIGVFICLTFMLVALGCGTYGTWRLYNDGTLIGEYKAMGTTIPAIQQTYIGPQPHPTFPIAVIPKHPNWHVGRSHGHPCSSGVDVRRYIWVVGGVTEIFIED